MDGRNVHSHTLINPWVITNVWTGVTMHVETMVNANSGLGSERKRDANQCQDGPGRFSLMQSNYRDSLMMQWLLT